MGLEDILDDKNYEEMKAKRERAKKKLFELGVEVFQFDCLSKYSYRINIDASKMIGSEKSYEYVLGIIDNMSDYFQNFPFAELKGLEVSGDEKDIERFSTYVHIIKEEGKTCIRRLDMYGNLLINLSFPLLAGITGTFFMYEFNDWSFSSSAGMGLIDFGLGFLWSQRFLSYLRDKPQLKGYLIMGRIEDTIRESAVLRQPL